MNASAILDVQRLTKSYRTNSGELTVLKDISFVLGPGATCSILGPSGSGKTTLLGLCAGLDLPTSGHVCLNGIARRPDSPAARAGTPGTRRARGARFASSDPIVRRRTTTRRAGAGVH